MKQTIDRLSEIGEQMPKAGCLEHIELMKEVKKIMSDAMNHNKKEVLDKVLEILDYNNK